MNIHEYQAKALLQKFGVAVPKGGVAYTPQEAEKVAARARRSRLCGEGANPRRRPRRRHASRTIPAARAACASSSRRPRPARGRGQMLGHVLVTKQTGPKGREVKRVYVEEGCDIKRELYLGMLIDRAHLARHRDGLDRRRHGDRGGGGQDIPRRSSASPSIPPPACSASTRAALAFGLGLEGKQVAGRDQVHARHVPGLHRARRLDRRDQSAGRHRRGRRAGARRQDEFRRQRALPPQGRRGDARRGRGGPDRARGRPSIRSTTSSSTAISAAW